MAIYLLTPIDTSAPDWRHSTSREAVQVEAGSELAARKRAALFLSAAAPHANRATDTGAVPWHRSGLVSARLADKIDPAVRLILAGDEPG